MFCYAEQGSYKISNVTQGPFVRDECNRCFSADEDADMH